MSALDKIYHIEKEVDRIAELCEKMAKDMGALKTDVAVLKTNAPEVPSKAKPAIAGGLGGILGALLALLAEYIKKS